jgi:molybdenum-dependent DNA-binding transcriptional regulator ModE
MVLRGLAIALVGALAVFALSAFGIDRFHFNPTAVLVFRIVAYTLLVGLLVRFTVLPLLKRVPDERVAMYLEEHEPSLEGGLVSAVEFGSEEVPGQHSQAFIEHLVRSAVDGCAGVDDGRAIDRKPIVRSSGLLAGATAMGMAMLLFGPASLQRGTQTLLAPWASAEERSPYGIDVLPGDTTVARGSDLRLSALLGNFDSDRVELAVKRGAATQWDRWPMTVDERTAEYAFLLFDLDERTEYFVEAAGVRSEVFEIEVADLPHVQQIDLEYHYPAYTRRKPQREEDGGDIAALRGTRVVLEVTPTISVDWAAILMDEQDTLTLDVAESGALRGEFRVQRDGFYRILFTTAAGKIVPGSSDYIIDVLTDEAPSVAITDPGRDLRVTNVEEVFAEIEAADDYGVGRLELIYSVNGGSEQTVILFEGTSIRQQVTASHTFFLEELDLRPGDLVSYFARARDTDKVTGPHEAVTDIYFFNVRPFDLEYRQADQQPGAGGGAGLNSALSERQRQIVAATFNIVRDRTGYSDKEYNENLATLALGQGRLREEVQTLLRRIRNRGVISLDTSFAEIAAALEEAVEAMQSAEQELGERAPQEALPPEQRALQQLQRAEAVFRQVQVSRGEGGGGGGGANPNAEDLADLFNLEMDKLRNQYEQVQRGQREETDAELDELMQKLRELARRQQQENERMRARAGQLQQQGGGGGGTNQRQLAEEAEQVARRLERLAREQRRPDLERTARELREAAEEMRRAATNTSDNGGVARGQSALQRLREARRLLDENRTAGLQQELDDALRRAERLAEMQEDITERVGNLGEGERGEAVRRLVERKEQMAAEVADLERQLDRLSQETRREQPAASRELTEAARGIRDDKLREKILYSRGVIQGRSQEYAKNFEEQIGEDLDALQERVREARGAMGERAKAR